MGLQKRTKTLSSLSRMLLAEGESERVDFKRSPEGVGTDDLVAFANSDTGGQILVGVDEQTVESRQRGIVRGCEVSDATILQILNKAVSCLPPVSVDVFIENLNAKPILRVSIPSSTTKPHCTPKGIYCRRDGSRNRPLHPSELLKIFLDTEARAFAERFGSAAEQISADLSNLEESLDNSINNMADKLGWADYQLGDTESMLGTILAHVRRLGSETGDITARLRSLFRQDKRDDPIQRREYRKFLNSLVKEINSRKDLLDKITSGQSLQIKEQSNTPPELTKDDVLKALAEAIDIIRKNGDLKKYAVVCGPPKRYAPSDLDQFAAVVGDGGWVVDGIRNQIERAYALGCITYEGKIVGTAALKKPKLAYRAEAFANAKSDANPKHYPLELDWICLQRVHRKKGQMTQMLRQLMPVAKDRSMFATNRSANDLMLEVLLQMGFQTDGDAYPCVERADQTLQLFLRPGNQ